MTTRPDPELDGFLALLATRRAPRTVEAYRRDLLQLSAWRRGSSAGRRPKSSSAGSPRCAPQASPPRRSRAGSLRSAPSSATRCCSAPGRTTQPPRLQLPKRARTLPKTLSPGEAERLIDAANGTTPRAMRDRALVELMYGAGLRVSEVTGLQRRSVDLEDRLVRALGKGSKERLVPLGRPAVDALRRYIAMGRPHLDRRNRPELFLNARGGPLTRAGCLPDPAPPRREGGPRAAARPPAPPPPLVRDPPARGRRRPTQRPGDAGPRRPLHDRALHARIRSKASGVVLPSAPTCAQEHDSRKDVSR